MMFPVIVLSYSMPLESALIVIFLFKSNMYNHKFDFFLLSCIKNSILLTAPHALFSYPFFSVEKVNEIYMYILFQLQSNKKHANPEPSTPIEEQLFSIDDEMYEEYKKYEQMYLKEKEEKLKIEERRINENITVSEDDENQTQLTTKISGDSAYGR